MCYAFCGRHAKKCLRDIPVSLLRRSGDSGSTWQEDSSVGYTVDWKCVASSADGTKLVAAVYGGNVWRSSNSGVTFVEDTAIGSTKDFRAIASSADGVMLVGAVYVHRARPGCKGLFSEGAEVIKFHLEGSLTIPITWIKNV